MTREEFAKRFIDLGIPLVEDEFQGLMQLISEVAIDPYIMCLVYHVRPLKLTGQEITT